MSYYVALDRRRKNLDTIRKFMRGLIDDGVPKETIIKSAVMNYRFRGIGIREVRGLYRELSRKPRGRKR